MRAAALLLALAACTPPARAPVTSTAPATATATIATQLARELGAHAPVAIVGTSAGVIAVAADGGARRVLTPEHARWVVVDHRSNVVWFGTEDASEIHAIDLDATTLAVTTVVTKIPQPFEMVGPASFGIAYPSGDDPEGMSVQFPDFATGSCCASSLITLLISDHPKLAAGAGYGADDDWVARTDASTIANPGFLVALAHRPAHARPEAAQAEPATIQVAGVDPKNCEDPKECGRGDRLGATHYFRVLVGHVVGDIGHFAYRLYDERTRAFVDAPWGAWMQNIRVAPDGSAFIAQGAVVRFDRGPLPATPADGEHRADGGGWLAGPDRFYPL